MPLDIELSLTGLDPALEGFGQVADQLERIQRGIDAANRAARDSRGGGAGGGGGGRPPGGGGAGSGAGGPGRPPPRPPLGPHERLRRADQAVRDALNSGDAGRIFDARDAQRRAREAYERARQRLEGGGPPPGGGPGGPGRGLQDVLRRLLGGGGLGGALLQFGKAGLIIGGTIKAIELLGRAATHAAAQVTDLEQARLTTGGDIRDIAQLHAIGGSVGMSAQDTANLSRSFADSLANNPFARSYFGQIDLQGPTGKLNKAEGLLRAVETLRSLPEDQAIRAAREGGVEALLRFRNLSGRTVQGLREDAATRSRVEDRDYVRSAQELETAQSRLAQSFESLLMEGVKPLIKPMAELAHGIANVLDTITNSMNTSQNVVDEYSRRAEAAERRGDTGEALRMRALGMYASLGVYSEETGKEANRIKRERDSKENATARATAETAANTSAMVLLLKDMRTVLGGGSAARTAYAGRWRYQTEREAATTAAIRQGAFSF